MIPSQEATPPHTTTPQTPSTSMTSTAKKAGGNVHGAESQSGGGEITEGSLRGAVYAGAIVLGVSCGASIICGAFVGAAAGFGGYAARYAGTRRWSWKRAGIETALGGLSGAAMGTGARLAGWRFSNTRGLGIRFSKGKTARRTDFTWKGARKFGFHSHRIPGQSRWKVLHYHRRPGIGRHRPWEGF